MSSQGPYFLLATSLIFLSKKLCFVFLTVSLNLFQSSSHLDCWYVFKSLWQLLFHHVLECLVIFTILECFFYILSISLASNWTITLRASMLSNRLVLSFLIEQIRFLTKCASSSLFLDKDSFLIWTHFSQMWISIVIGAWSNVSHYSRWIWWLLSSIELGCKNTRSSTKFELWALSKYLVEIFSVDLDNSIWKKSVISKRTSLWEEWKE